jgi:ABC-2 type transport system ATP-binding protein
MHDDIAISVQGVSKSFKLPHEKHTGLKQAVLNFRPGKKYEMQHVLKDISFDIKKGEFFGIVGRNGSGKSTMLKVLAQIYTPEEGGVAINGSLTPFIELGVGFNPELTGRENVYLNGALLGFDRKQMDLMYDDIVSFAEIDRFMDQKLKNYSSGMQVRLAFSIAIRAQSDILLIDEVLAVGDAAFQQKCFDYFLELKTQKKTAILVSHDLASVKIFCDRVAIIDQGELIDVGPGEEMIMAYQTRLANGTLQNEGSLDHQGTGDYQIISVETLNSKRQVTRSLGLDEPFTIRTAVEAKVAVEEYVVGIAIEDQEGNSLIGPNSLDAGLTLTGLEIGHGGVIETYFKTNPLTTGVYSVTVGVFNEKGITPYDFSKRATTFNIIGKAGHGRINIEPEWSIT